MCQVIMLVFHQHLINFFPFKRSSFPRCGLYSLTSRGFLPREADLTPGFLEYKPVMKTGAVKFGDSEERKVRTQSQTMTNHTGMLVKLDLRPTLPRRPASAKGTAARPMSRSYVNEKGRYNSWQLL